MTRVLVVDGSHLMCWLVEHLAPRDVRVEQATTFRQAHEVLTTRPPQAVIFSITPCHLEWRALIELCRQHEPPIPFFCCTSLPESHELVPCLDGDLEGPFLKPLLVTDLRLHLRELIDRAVDLDTVSHRRHDQLQ